MAKEKTIVFLGAGSMASAMIAGLISNRLVAPDQIVATNVSNRKRLEELAERYHIHTTQDRKEAVSRADIVIFAMKPKDLKAAIEEIRPSLRVDEQLYVSVLAGIPTAYIERLLGAKASVIRTMPNTSASVGASATAICKGAYATDEQLAEVKRLFSAIGSVTVVKEEKLDAITGVAGSGPAYFYFIVEAMEKAAIESGLTEEEAKSFITQTIVGVGKRLQSTTKTAKQLYEEVMSPQGTTEAGINVLREHHVQRAIETAVLKAVARSKELGNSFQ